MSDKMWTLLPVTVMAMKGTPAGHIEFPTAKDAPRRHSVQAGSTVDITNPLLI